MDYDGFTPDLIARVLEVPGVYGLWPSTWPETPPLLVTSARLSYPDLWGVIAEHYSGLRRPSVRQVVYVDDEVSFEQRMRPARALANWALERDIVIDVAYPVTGYQRIYVELPWQDPAGRFTAQPPRWLRARAAHVALGDWPIEVRERPWVDSISLLDTPPAEHPRGPISTRGRAAAWVDDAAQHAFDVVARLTASEDSVEVMWEPWDRGTEGRLYVRWADGPLVEEVARHLSIDTSDRNMVLPYDGHDLPVVLTRGLSYGFQFAAMQRYPEILLDPSPFSRIESGIPSSELDPHLVAAWSDQVRADPFDQDFERRAVRAYLARHGAAVAAAASRRQ